MKKSNFLVFAVALLASAFLLFLWYYLGFNHIDDPFDLVVSILWWLVIALLVGGIIYVERKRQRQIRTIYVSPTALYNSEQGIVGLHDTTTLEAMRTILEGLEYGFGKEDLPDRKTFDYRFVVQTDEYKPVRNQGEEDSQPKWTGKVIKIDRENGNVETQFEGEQQLRAALAA